MTNQTGLINSSFEVRCHADEGGIFTMINTDASGSRGRFLVPANDNAFKAEE